MKFLLKLFLWGLFIGIILLTLYQWIYWIEKPIDYPVGQATLNRPYLRYFLLSMGSLYFLIPAGLVWWGIKKLSKK
jgi:hypothetical protein